ncbi:DUF3152 domain-containing protein [Streptomyces sp. NPDC051561]|uniref:DUF3152 domain-containing protein n=1 Tax=Streptomyces sp. NPDC051561 TaxID=3365658 RepID=UPI0037B1E797
MPRIQESTGQVPRFQPHHLAGGPAQHFPQGLQQPVRGGHPEQREAGGGWGDPGSYGRGEDTGSGRYGDWVGAPRGAAYAPPSPRPPSGVGLGARVPGARPAGPHAPGPHGPGPHAPGPHAPGPQVPGPQVPGPHTARPHTSGPHASGPHGPRQDFVAAFDGPQPRVPQQRRGGRDPYEAVTDWDEAAAVNGDLADPDDADFFADTAAPRTKRRRARTVTGVSAAALTVALAVVVTVQQQGSHGTGAKDTAASEAAQRKLAEGSPSRDEDRQAPQGGAEVKAAPKTYEQRLAQKLEMAPDQHGPNTFDVIPGESPAPHRAKKTWTYRVDVEKGMGLDGNFFADALQKTLNDKRSWAGNGEMAFHRISKEKDGKKPDFVVTLATPYTTDIWCEKSALNTIDQNVSCDSAATERVMINAYRWAGGSPTFGPGKLMEYRQMLLNHEVGHRLGHGHKDCATDGALAPVMMQQTKTLETGSKKCRPNAWVHPES